jgi:MFS family permease
MPEIKKRLFPRVYYGYWIILALFLCQVIVHGTSIYSFSLFVVPLDNAFGWSRTSIMTGYLLNSLAAGLAAPLVGGMISRIGVKRMMMAGGVCLGAGFFLLSTMQHIWQFYLYYALVGIGYTAAGVVPATAVVASWFQKNRGFAIGLVGIGLGLGGFVMPLVMGGLVMPNFTWQASYCIMGAIAAVVIIPLAVFIVKFKPPDIPVIDTSRPSGRPGAAPIDIEAGVKARDAFRMPVFWFLGIAIFLMSMGMSNTLQNQVPHLQGIGFAAVFASAVMQATGIGSAAGKMIFGWLCDYIKPKYVLMMGCTVTGAAGLLLMTLNSSTPIAIIWICGLVTGLGVGCWLPAISLNTSYTFGLVSYGVLFGIYQMVFQVAGAVGPVVGGFIFDLDHSYNNSFLLGIVFQVIAIGFAIAVSRPKKA